MVYGRQTALLLVVALVEVAFHRPWRYRSSISTLAFRLAQHPTPRVRRSPRPEPSPAAIGRIPESNDSSASSGDSSTNLVHWSDVEGDDATALQQRARALREEAQALQDSLQRQRLERRAQHERSVDRWMDDLLVQRSIDNSTQLLNTVEQVTQILQDRRYSPEQVDEIFERLCQTCRITGRDSLDSNPLLRLLVEASGKVDELERTDNPNKRWNGRVERGLHKKLFAREWNIDLEQLSSDD